MAVHTRLYLILNKIINKIGEINTDLSDSEYLEMARILAEEYSSYRTYSIGQFCEYNDFIYECIVDTTLGETWTPSHWELLGSA